MKTPVDEVNGLQFNSVYIPEEILINILSFIEPQQLLKFSLVCKNWHRIIKSTSLWTTIYSNKYNCKSKALPWYVYHSFFTKPYFTNLLVNGCGQDEHKSWQRTRWRYHRFKIEDPPIRAAPLPLNVPEFEGHTSCFSRAQRDCSKFQRINIENDKLLFNIIYNYRPHLYVSDWVLSKTPSASQYALDIELTGQDYCATKSLRHEENQWIDNVWTKVEMIITDYPVPLYKIGFVHSVHSIFMNFGYITKHYEVKVAGPVVKFVFDSIHSINYEVGNARNNIFD